MARQALFYTAVLIGGYLAAVYATNYGRLLLAGGQVYQGGVRTLQGR